MAKEFSPNLADGELWLPSEIIPEVGSFSPISSGAAATDLEALAMELAAFGFYEPYPNPNKRPPAVKTLPDLAEGFRPANRFGLRYEEYRALAGPGSYLQFVAANPVQPQKADGFRHGRGRGPLQRQQQSVGPAPAHFFPSRVNGSGRSCGGTGVFLPRAVNNEVKRMPGNVGLRGGEQQRQPKMDEQMQVMKPLIRQVQPHQQELTLPQEWTY